MDDERFAQITNDYIRGMPLTWAMRYCGVSGCYCRGCAGVSGKLIASGVTREEWKEWWARHQQNMQHDVYDKPA